MRTSVSGRPLQLVRDEPHEILPVPGTFRRAFDSRTVSPPMPWDFPLLADCEACGQEIRMRSSLFADWQHSG